jgi:DNA-binding transcriptional LysR family regulator
MATRGVDVLVALGWPGSVELVQRPLALSLLVVCASPAYLRRQGVPAQPSDLVSRAGPLVRSPEGTALDLWRYARGVAVVSGQ